MDKLHSFLGSCYIFVSMGGSRKLLTNNMPAFHLLKQSLDHSHRAPLDSYLQADTVQSPSKGISGVTLHARSVNN